MVPAICMVQWNATAHSGKSFKEVVTFVEYIWDVDMRDRITPVTGKCALRREALTKVYQMEHRCDSLSIIMAPAVKTASSAANVCRVKR